MNPVYKSKKALMQAFQAAKAYHKSSNSIGNDYI